jgi:hypothetical protein
MMDPDKELELLEQEFPRSRKAWIRETPIELDDRILSLAARHAPYLEAQYKIKQEQYKLEPDVGTRERIPPISRPPRGKRPTFYSIDMTSVAKSIPALSRRSMKVSRRRESPAPPGAEKLLVMLEGANQQEWLDQIASIVQLGNIDLAIYLLGRYRDRFSE